MAIGKAPGDERAHAETAAGLRKFEATVTSQVREWTAVVALARFSDRAAVEDASPACPSSKGNQAAKGVCLVVWMGSEGEESWHEVMVRRRTRCPPLFSAVLHFRGKVPGNGPDKAKLARRHSIGKQA